MSLWFLFLLMPVLVLNVLYWIRIKEFFAKGDANPGIIIQLNPVLIAVATDLVQHSGSYPAIKVISTQLKSFMGQPPQVGMAVPTVALYYRPLDKNCPHWADLIRDHSNVQPATKRFLSGWQRHSRNTIGSF
ncbi:MAG: DUF3239 domain-containing protein [Verrucomicrobiota bacterium]